MVFIRGLKNQNVDVKPSQRCLDLDANVSPGKLAVARSKRGDGHGLDLVLDQELPEILQALGDPFHARVAPPVLFGGEVDDPAGTVQFVRLCNEHLASPDFARLASRCVQAKVVLEPLFEHQRDALAHDADGVDRVDQRLGVSLQEVALRERDH